ncbi:hypothetical protein PV783_13165 [Chitinophaga sp. CC14]|uniref:hypothetical protein n=1 Tax=Chitinophaga sp. CC14 TaxID=3029199 RepID=UPI003B7A4DE3
MKTRFFFKLACCTGLLAFFILYCSKDADNKPDDGIKVTVETTNGVTYKLFVKEGATSPYGILVMGSGNDAENPGPGSLDGDPEIALCRKAAENNYIAAIVQYRKTPGLADWDASSNIVAEDYDKCITALAGKFGLDKNQSVVGGYSYAAYMLLNNTAWTAKLAYCKGVLAACGAIEGATYFHLPIYTITCSGSPDPGGLAGKALYDAINNSSPFKLNSEGVTDTGCNSHCGGNWTNRLFTKMQNWLAA